MYPHPPAPLTPSPPVHSVADLLGQGSDKTLETAPWALDTLYEDLQVPIGQQTVPVPPISTEISLPTLK